MGQARQRRFEDHRGRTIPAKKRAAYLKDAPAGDLSGAFLAAMKSRGWLAGDEATRGSLRASGRRRAAEFTWARTARLTLEVYRRVA